MMEKLAIGMSLLILLYGIFVWILTKLFFSEKKLGKISLKRWIQNVKDKLAFDGYFRKLEKL